MFTTKVLLFFALIYVVTVPATTRHVSKVSTHKLLDIIHRLLNVAGRQHHGRLVAFDVELAKYFKGRKDPDKVPYDLIKLNYGGAYHEGEFVCPLDGVYEFRWTSLGYNGRNGGTAIYVNNKRRRYNYNNDSTGKLHFLSTMAIISHLKKGDRVWIGIYNGHIIQSNGNGHSSFQGKLLQAD